MVDVAVIDYGMGNLHSVVQALRKVSPGKNIIISNDARVIAQAGRVVFPGQGAMPECMRELEVRGLRNVVLEAARDKPFLGICIGLQMLFEHSDEGDVAGLGVLQGEVVRFAANLCDAMGNKLKVPHMGWNQVRHLEGEDTISPYGQEGKFGSGDATLRPHGELTVAPSLFAGGLARGGARQTLEKHPLWAGIAQDTHFYFVHSYYVCIENMALAQATSDYVQPFVCAVAHENLFAVQFHPEKSQTAGLKLLQNFVQWNP